MYKIFEFDEWKILSQETSFAIAPKNEETLLHLPLTLALTP